jgi:hypothetical protein
MSKRESLDGSFDAFRTFAEQGAAMLGTNDEKAIQAPSVR